MADLSQLSDEDLTSLSKGDLTKMSDQGLKHLHQETVKDHASSAGPAYTLGERTANAAIGGYLPQAVALSAKVAAPIYDAVTGSHVTGDLPSYTELRDQTAAELEKHKKENPRTGWTGDIGGGILGAMGVGALGKLAGLISKAPEAATLGQKMITSAKGGALLGGFSNPGETPGEISPVQPVERVVNAAVGGAASAALTPAWEGAKIGGSKLLGITTNTPSHAVQSYGERAQEVSKMLKRVGNELPVAADEMKDKILNDIASKKKEYSQMMSEALASPKADEPSLSIHPILTKLSKTLQNLDPKYQVEERAQINDMAQYVSQGTSDGHVSLKQMMAIKDHFKEMADGSFKGNGDLFAPKLKDASVRAAQGANQAATAVIHEASPPIAYADKMYSQLHDIDNKMSAALLGTGKSESVFASAGGGNGNINQVMLRKIGELTGTNPVSDANLIYSAKYFKDPSIRQGLLRMGLNIGNAASSLLPSGTPGALIRDQMTPVERRLEANRKLGSQGK